MCRSIVFLFICITTLVEFHLFHYIHLHRVWKWIIKNRCQGMEAPPFEQRKCIYIVVCASVLNFVRCSLYSIQSHFCGRAHSRYANDETGNQRHWKENNVQMKALFFLFLFCVSYFIQDFFFAVFSHLSVAFLHFLFNEHGGNSKHQDRVNTIGTHNVKNILWFNAVGIYAESLPLI